VFRSLSARAALVGVAALALTTTGLATVEAAAPAQPTVLDRGLVAPLSVAIADDNTIYYSANFAGELYRKAPGKKPKVVFRSKQGKEVGAVSTRGGTTFFVSGFTLMRRTPKGKVSKVANLRAYEKAENPDGGTSYGLVDAAAECVDAWPTGEDFPPAQYPGIVESHPYGSAVSGRTVYVADAAANAILAVRGDKVRTVAVLPPVPVEITPELAGQFGIPDVCIGETYAFEGVPTDVETGPDGMLYVSGLPGGEIPGEGYVSTVDPHSGDVEKVASGLVAATGVAVLPSGAFYVSQLFAGEITRIGPNGSRKTFASVPLPSAVELKGRKVYATINVLAGLEPGQKPGGKLVRFDR
jgi:hypothetical protein